MLDDAFHQALCDLSEHRAVWPVSQRARGHLNRVRRLSMPVPSYLALMIEQHRRVVAAVADHDCDGAEAVLRDHLRNVLQEVPRIRAQHPGFLRGGLSLGHRTRHTDLLAMYEQMLLIRVFETEAERQYKAAKIGGYCHLSSGQEATCVGVVDAMQDDDLLVTGYRSHGFALARGTSPEAVMAELFGRRDGCAHGRGGSMHLLDTERGYYGGWGIVGGQLPLATGLALALVRQGKPQAVVCELGDGAVNMGAWHESLNLAALWRLPVVFLVVNNKYGMGTAVERASAEPELHKRASAYRMHGEAVDGDDLEARDRRHVAAARARPRGARARGARGDHLPLPRPLGRRRRAGLPHQGRDHRAPGARPAAADGVQRLREAGATHRGPARDRRARRGARAGRGRVRRTRARSPTSAALAWAMYARARDEQFARMRPGSPFGEEELVFDGGLGK